MHDRFPTTQRELRGVQHFLEKLNVIQVAINTKKQKIGAYYSEEETYMHQNYVACAYILMSRKELD